MTSMASVVHSLAAQGQRGDRLMGHLTPGDVIVPKEIQTPQLKAALHKLFAQHEIDSGEFTAGHPKNKRNPKTGAPEFGVSTEKRIASDEQELNALTQAYQTPGDPNYQNPQTLAQIQQIQGTIPGLAHKAAATTSYNDFFSNPLVEPITDLALAFTPAAPLIPLANAAETKLGGGSNLQALESGGEAYAAQEVLEGLANQFPETATSIFPGIDTSGNILTGNGSLTGSGTIGGVLSNAYNGVTGVADSIFGTGTGADPLANISNTNVTPTTASTAPTDASTSATGAPTNLPANTTSAGAMAGGTPGGGGGAAGAGIITDPAATGTLADTSTLPGSSSGLPSGVTDAANIGNAASQVPSAQSPSLSTSPGNPQLGNLSQGTQNFISGITPADNALNPSIIAASNEATPGGASINNDTQQGFWSNLTGSDTPVPQANGLNPVSSPSLQSAGAAANAAPPGNSILNAINGTGGWGTALANNAGSLAAAAGIGLAALRNKNNSTSTGGVGTGAGANIDAIANQQQAQGTQLQSYLQTGTLPPGLQAGIDQQVQSAIATIKSRYASMGMSGSSAEQQDIANAQAQGQAAAAQQAEQLLSTGINETGMASTLYNQIAQKPDGE